MSLINLRSDERLIDLSTGRALEQLYKWISQVQKTVAGLSGTLTDLSGDVGGLPTFGTAATKNVGTSGATVPLLNGVNAWSGQQYFAMATLTDAASVAWDLDTAQVATLTLGGNRTLANPTNMKAGGTYQLIVRQDGTGSRTLAYDTAYLFPSSLAPTLSTGASAIDIITFLSDGTNMLGVCIKEFG